MRKNIRYFVYMATIILLAGIYLYSLNPSVQYSTVIKDKFNTYSRYFPFLILIIFCFINIIKVATRKERYEKLPDEEKGFYEPSKVKITYIAYSLSLAFVTVFEFVFWVICPNIIAPMVLIVCFLVEIVIVLIFENTKLVLNWFCKKK